MLNARISLLAALAAAALSCSPVYAAKPLTIAAMDAEIYDLPLVYAKKEGAFAAGGITMERMSVARGVTALVVSGQADLALVSMVPVLAAYQSGADLKVLAFMYPRFDIYAVSRFKPGDGARIKTIVLNSSGGASRLLLDPFIDYLNADRGSLRTVIAATDAARYAMLEMGYADLTNISSPELLAKIRAEKKYYLIPIAATGTTGEPSILVASGKAVRKRGEELGKFTKILYSTIKAAAADKEKTVKLLADEYKYSPEEAALFYDSFAAASRDLDYVPSAARLEAVSAKINEDGFKAVKGYKDLAFPDYALKAVLADYRSPFVK